MSNEDEGGGNGSGDSGGGGEGGEGEGDGNTNGNGEAQENPQDDPDLKQLQRLQGGSGNGGDNFPAGKINKQKRENEKEEMYSFHACSRTDYKEFFLPSYL